MKTKISSLFILLPFACLGQLKPLTLVQSGYNGKNDTLKLPCYVSTTDDKQTPYTRLVFCSDANVYNGYCDAIRKAVKDNFKDTLTYNKRETLEIFPIIDNKGNVVRLLISMGDMARFSKRYEIS